MPSGITPRRSAARARPETPLHEREPGFAAGPGRAISQKSSHGHGYSGHGSGGGYEYV